MASWPTIRKQVLERDGYKCTQCGAAEELHNRLHAHHITPRSEGGPDDLENLTALCQECHYGVHREADRVYWEARRAYDELRQKEWEEFQDAWKIHLQENDYPDTDSLIDAHIKFSRQWPFTPEPDY